MKTVPTVVVAELTDTASMPGLPESVTLALTDIAGAAREGLLAMSVAAGMAVMQAMLEAETTALAGPKGKHDPDRTANRHGTASGSVTLGGRRGSLSSLLCKSF
jgi:putative transposase